MTYTEIKERNGNKYYYRVRSVREGEKVKKDRIYLGKNLLKSDMDIKIKEADKKFIDNNLDSLKKKIVRVLKKYDIKKAGLFGSYVRGEQKKNSDIDIIVEPPNGIGFGFAGIQLDLEEKLNKKVDLVTYKYLSPYLKKNILDSEVRII